MAAVVLVLSAVRCAFFTPLPTPFYKGVCEYVTFSEGITEVRVRTEAVFQRQRMLLRIEGEAADIHIGNRLSFSGEDYPFRSSTGPGQYDEKKYYESMGYAGRINVSEYKITDSSSNFLKERLRSLRGTLSAAILRNMPEKEAGVLISMLLGDKQRLFGDIRELYREHGIAHILAISGLHISIIGMAVFKGLKKLGLSNTPAGLISFFLLISYGYLTDFSVSTNRAVVMTIISIFALIFGRTYDILSGTAFAMILILFMNYREAGAAGFQLSFAAVIAVSLFVENEARRKESVAGAQADSFKKSALKRLGTVLTANLFITLMTLPIVLWHYFELPLAGLLLNPVVIPLMSVLVPCGIIGSVLCAAPQSLCLAAGRFFMGSCYFILKLYEKLCALCDRLPLRKLIAGRPALWQVVLFYLCVLSPLVYYELKERRMLKSAFADSRFKINGTIAKLLIGFVALVIIFLPKTDRTVTMLDVGQGESIVIRDRGDAYLIDCGSTSVKNVGTYRLIPFLKYYGIDTLQAVIITHFDEDHISGIRELLENEDICVKQFIFSAAYTEGEKDKDLADRFAKLLKAAGAPPSAGYTAFSRGAYITDKKMKLECISPEKNAPEGNDGSIVMLLGFEDCKNICISNYDGSFEDSCRQDDGYFNMYLMGDASSETEAELIGRGQIRDADVLKAGHHGSRYSTSEAWLYACKPEYALISAPQRSVYGHPHKETLDRLANVECRTVMTLSGGAITIKIR